MREEILERLRRIEEREQVRILHAVESGSRAWGFASPDSDYDVRFVYVRPAQWYLKLGKTRDVLEYPVDPVWDVCGWDLQKALRLMHSSNPSLFEWLDSPVVYRTEETVLADLRAAGAACYRKRAGVNHYLSMAKNGWLTHLQSEAVRAKKYLYVLRSILACRWILERGTPPPVPFELLSKSCLPDSMRSSVERLMEEKRQLPESGRIPHIAPLNRYFEESMAEIARAAAELPKEPAPDWAPLDALFLRVVGWKGETT